MGKNLSNLRINNDFARFFGRDGRVFLKIERTRSGISTFFDTSAPDRNYQRRNRIIYQTRMDWLSHKLIARRNYFCSDVCFLLYALLSEAGSYLIKIESNLNKSGLEIVPQNQLNPNETTNQHENTRNESALFRVDSCIFVVLFL